jgi:ankyrin repeat protein
MGRAARALLLAIVVLATVTLYVVTRAYPAYDRLFDAIRGGNTLLVRLALLTGSDVNGCDYPGPTRSYSTVPAPPLLDAVERKDVGSASALLRAGAKPNIFVSEGFTPLERATIQHDPEMVSLLLTYGADPFAQSADGTVLDSAQAHGDATVIRILNSYATQGATESIRAHHIPWSCVYHRTPHQIMTN